MIDQSTLDYDDMFSGLSDDILKNIFIRFYTMEQYYEVEKQQGEPKQKRAVTMIFNKAIHDCINKLFISNKLIYSKAKLVSCLIENGFDISAKKNEYWKCFLEEPQFKKISQAYQLVSKEKQKIIKYAVLSISNILLKLSINMSKISIIPLQKFLTFQSLNIHILSILFLQFLEYRLLVAKNNTDPNQDKAFLKQLPKITVIKLGRYKNNTEVQLLEKSQNHLFTNKGKLETPINNLQLIEIHELNEDPLYPKFQRKTGYEHITSFCLETIGKGSIRSPFTFEILFFMEMIVHPLVREFRPDLILYIEQYPPEMKIMDEEIRGLMISQLTEQTACQKIYVFKELGFDKPALLKGNLLEGETIQKETEQLMEKIQQTQSEQLLKNKSLDLKKAKRILLDDLCFIALALIQKTSFQNALQASHKHFYPIEYLEGLFEECERLKSNSKNVNESFFRVIDQKIFALKNMMDMSKIFSRNKNQMIDEKQQSGFHVINLMNTSTEFSSFYDLLNKEEQKLELDSTTITFNEEDYFYVKYYPNRLLVFIIKSQNHNLEMIILSKNCEDKVLKLQKIVKFSRGDHDLEGATYIASDNYLYRGFGRFRYRPKDYEGDFVYNQAIHRFQIYPELGDQWILVSNKSSMESSNSTIATSSSIQLQKKIYGYGIFDNEINKSSAQKYTNLMMFVGGYLDSATEQKISTKIYLIFNADDKEKNEIKCIGKTNKVLFNGVNEPINKVFLHPFVFGIPFKHEKTFILNGNGSYIHLNNTNKIFGTMMKISPISVYNGITNQIKLKIPNESAKEASEVILIAELISKLLVSSPYQNNILKEQCCIQTLEEGIIHIRVNASSSKEKKVQVLADQELFGTKQPFVLTFI